MPIRDDDTLGGYPEPLALHLITPFRWGMRTCILLCLGALALGCGAADLPPTDEAPRAALVAAPAQPEAPEPQPPAHVVEAPETAPEAPAEAEPEEADAPEEEPEEPPAPEPAPEPEPEATPEPPPPPPTTRWCIVGYDCDACEAEAASSPGVVCEQYPICISPEDCRSCSDAARAVGITGCRYEVCDTAADCDGDLVCRATVTGDNVTTVCREARVDEYGGCERDADCEVGLVCRPFPPAMIQFRCLVPLPF